MYSNEEKIEKLISQIDDIKIKEQLVASTTESILRQYTGCSSVRVYCKREFRKIVKDSNASILKKKNYIDHYFVLLVSPLERKQFLLKASELKYRISKIGFYGDSFVFGISAFY